MPLIFEMMEYTVPAPCHFWQSEVAIPTRRNESESRNAVTLADVLAARRMVQRHAWRTPLMPSAALGKVAGCRASLKMECWQHTGSFKVRGALSKLSALSPEEWERGVVTASAGNHGLGVAYASQVLGLPPVTIFVPEGAPQAKVERLRAFNCEIRRAGADYDAAHAIAESIPKRREPPTSRRTMTRSSSPHRAPWAWK